MPNHQKSARLRALANESGVIAALAIDQRGSLRKLLTEAAGAGAQPITDQQLSEFKEVVTRHLTPCASAILIDPELGLAAVAAKAKTCGLLLTYESDGFDNPRPHRMLQLMPEYSVRRLCEIGAQGIKVLLSWAPDGDAASNGHKRVMIERIGAECDALDVPFFLEPVVYDPAGLGPKDPAFLKQKPVWVMRTMQEFSHPRFSVDVLKVEFPVNASVVRDGVLTKSEALDWYRRADAASGLPYIYLSAGVSNEEFTSSLRLAAESGARFSGVLCGRANWQGGAPAFLRGGSSALTAWLAAEGIKNMAAVNDCLTAAVGWEQR
jgi:tagatose 1,6-diphosphate aldolase